MISRVVHFFETEVWEIRARDLPLVKGLLLRALRTGFLASRRFLKDKRQDAAAVLTYYSLLNAVPVVAVAFAVAKGFGLEAAIGSQIAHIGAEANWPPTVTHQLLTFSHNLLEQAKGGWIAGAGVILLLWTLVSILARIEGSLNDVWEVSTSRTLVRKFSDYMAVVVLGPLLLVISGGVNVLLASQVPVFLHKTGILGPLSNVILLLLQLVPYVSIWVLLTVLYLVMPNTTVPIRSALLGGIIAGTIIQIVQWIYVRFQIGVASYSAIYGTFAALPLFLAWLQTSWMIVLFGAEIAFANDHYETYGFHPDYSRISVSLKRLLMLRICHFLVKRFASGDKPSTIREIDRALQIPGRLVKHLLKELKEAGLVTETSKGIRGEVAFQPGMAIEKITIQFAVEEFENKGTGSEPGQSSQDQDEIAARLKEISEAIRKMPANVRLDEL